MTNDELKNILDSHSLWLRTNGAEGKRANLYMANLAYANLAYANLEKANLRWANLVEANLAYANLEKANLEGANLLQAHLYGANLEGANLVGAILNGTILDKKKEEEVSPETSNINLRAKFDEFAKSLGLEIVSLEVKRTETIDL